MDILIKADEILSATKYKSGKACIWVGGFEGATEIPEHGDLIDRDKLISKIETHCSSCGADCIECQVYRVQDFTKDAEVVLEAST